MWHLNKMFREVGAVKMYPVDDYWTCRVLGSMDDDDDVFAIPGLAWRLLGYNVVKQEPDPSPGE